jgi:hypothetical protein
VHDAGAENLSNSTTYVRPISKWIDFLLRNWLSRIYHWGYSAVVTLPGSFRIRQRKPRTGRNPKTGDKVEVPAKRVPYFKPSKELRDLVNPKADGAGIKEQGSAAGDH